jgi:hypothetical protein
MTERERRQERRRRAAARRAFFASLDSAIVSADESIQADMSRHNGSGGEREFPARTDGPTPADTHRYGV